MLRNLATFDRLGLRYRDSTMDERKFRTSKGENWEKRKAFYKYKKLLRKEGLSFPKREETSRPDDRGKDVKQKSSNKLAGRKRTNRMLQEYKKSETVKKNREEDLNVKRERLEEKEKRRRQKKRQHQKMTQRTKKGQPLMKNKMEIMLEKITKNKDIYLT